jgi:hypothetical protein
MDPHLPDSLHAGAAFDADRDFDQFRPRQMGDLAVPNVQVDEVPAGGRQRRRDWQVGLRVIGNRTGEGRLAEQAVEQAVGRLVRSCTVILRQQAVDIEPAPADLQSACHGGEAKGIGRRRRNGTAAEDVARERTQAPVDDGAEFVEVGVEDDAALLQLDAGKVEQGIAADS